MEKVRLVFKSIYDSCIVTIDAELDRATLSRYEAIDARVYENNAIYLMFQRTSWPIEVGSTSPRSDKILVRVGTRDDIDFDGVYSDRRTLLQKQDLRFIGLQWLPDAETQEEINQRRKEKHDQKS